MHFLMDWIVFTIFGQRVDQFDPLWDGLYNICTGGTKRLSLLYGGGSTNLSKYGLFDPLFQLILLMFVYSPTEFFLTPFLMCKTLSNVYWNMIHQVSNLLTSKVSTLKLDF